MSISYEKAKSLKDAGFPQGNPHEPSWIYVEVEGQDDPDEVWGVVTFPQIETKIPTLSELIHECGRPLQINILLDGTVIAAYPPIKSDSEEWPCLMRKGEDVDTAVANLYLTLHKK